MWVQVGLINITSLGLPHKLHQQLGLRLQYIAARIIICNAIIIIYTCIQLISPHFEHRGKNACERGTSVIILKSTEILAVASKCVFRGFA